MLLQMTDHELSSKAACKLSKKQWLRTKLKAAKLRVTQHNARFHTPQQFPSSRWSTHSNPLFAEDSMPCDVETVDRQDAVQTASYLLATNDKVQILLMNKSAMIACTSLFSYAFSFCCNI